MGYFSPKEFIKTFKEKDGDVKALYLLGSFALIAAGFGLSGIIQNDEIENNIPLFDDPIDSCAYDILTEEQASVTRATEVIEECDAENTLEDLQIIIRSHTILKAVQDQQ